MATTITETWFEPVQEEDELIMLTRVADACGWRLRSFMVECELFTLMEEGQVGIGEREVLMLLEEAQGTLSRQTSLIRDRVFARPTPPEILQYRQRQKEAGLTRNSLLVKLSVLERLYKKIVEHVKRWARSIADALRKQIQQVWKALRSFLSYLNKLMSSIKHVLPPMEALKEVKDVVEASLDLYDDSKDLATDAG